MLKIKLLIIGLFLVNMTLVFGQTNGKIMGKVVDKANGEALIGVNIILEGTSTGAASDLEGNYQILNVPVGKYNLIASMIGYTKTRVEGVEVKENETTVINITLSSELIETEDVVVEAKRLTNTEASLLKVRQKSVSISDAISLEEISKAGDNDVASAMTKVIGASVVDGKYVYIRGLGERYSSTHLNGVELPNANPDKRSFQLDLFPTNILDNITTIKSFTPDKPGNFSGGIVDIGTKTYPENFTFKISASSSYNTSSNLNNNFLSQTGSNSDWFGFDDGFRDLPDILNDPNLVIPSETQARTDEEKALLLDKVSKSFFPEMSPKSKKSPINQNYALSLGDNINIFGNPFGYIASFTYSRNYNYYDNGKVARWKLTGKVDQNESLTNLTELNDFQGQDEVNWGGLISLNYRFHPNHQITGDFLVTQSGTATSKYLSGIWPEQFVNTTTIFETRTLNYTERNLTSYQINGKHNFPSIAKISIDWDATISKTNQDEPDVRYFSDNYSHQNIQGRDTIVYSITPSIYPRPARYFRNLDENSTNLMVNLVLPFNQWNDLSSKIKIGWSYNEKDRDFKERRYEYKQAAGTRYYGNPEEFFSLENSGILRYDSTTNRYIFGNYISESPDARGGNYWGDERIIGGYAMIDLPITSKLRIIGGARLELTKMNVYGKDTSGYLDDNDILPSVSFIYNLIQDMNLRLSYGKTLARPNFREKAPYSSYEFANDFVFVGNPNLKRTLIDNYDFRWEWYERPGEIYAFSFFYKKFKNPIERVINVLYASEGGEVLYSNVDEATVYGAEFEIRKRLDQISDLLSNFSLGANLSLIHSEVKIPSEELIIIRDLDPNASDTRKLQGQSPYLLNIEVGYDNPKWGTSTSLFFNIVGERLAEISLGGTPDVFESTRPILDYTISQNIWNNINIKFSVKNILNSPYKLKHEYNGKEYIRAEYKTGTTFSLGLNYNVN